MQTQAMLMTNEADQLDLQSDFEAGEIGEKKFNRRMLRLQGEHAELSNVIPELVTLAGSSQMYDIKISDQLNTKDATVASASFNPTNGNFEITMPSNSGLGLFSHEVKHAHQFEMGAYSVGPKRRESGLSNYPNLLYDQSDEVAAFARGHLFGGDYRSASSIASDPHYGTFPVGPVDFRIVPNINNYLSIPSALQQFANGSKHAFRINGATYYKPK